ncbi:hypothetical protein HYH03_013738 [Edaphochlamys debaryana]|uniref:SET domain-containing protein n=1 Tax=Edaphochlamys debaryana TaxID=47281 RepID=A0A835XQG0_9CHLO|nr:hypothetical protein HYH03_013738 [Edaphochlamys debaryana]|eukprot:KAG2487740.1 hypothetical protein HYH03_013738 [Edaphochlamys debaryana]
MGEGRKGAATQNAEPLTAENWRTTLSRAGWLDLLVSLTSTGLGAVGLASPVVFSLQAAEERTHAELCEPPRWLQTPGELPTQVKGVQFEAVPWTYRDSSWSVPPSKAPAPANGGASGSSGGGGGAGASRPEPPLPLPPPAFKPNVVYVAGAGSVRSDRLAFQDLHARCVQRGRALKCHTAASTPNHQWALLLVAGHTPSAPPPPPASAPEAAHTAGAHTAARSHAPLRACFHAYFLPYNPNRDDRNRDDRKDPARDDRKDPARDDRKDPPMNAWLERWLGTKLRGTGQVKEISAWRREWRDFPTQPSTGLPKAERRVHLEGYYGQHPMHTAHVQSVLPGRHFFYSMRPWRRGELDEKGRLVPVLTDQQADFLRECQCDYESCGKLEARRELKRIREDGVQFDLAIKAVQLEAQRPDLGVFALEFIPAGSFVLEYVGQLMVKRELNAMEKANKKADLHYIYDLEQRSSRPSGPDDVVATDATHLGNISRFLNHRCDGANCETVNVCAGRVDERHMTIMIRTVRDIYPGEQLTLDYQAGLTAEQRESVRAHPELPGAVVCRCGEEQCLGFVFPSVDAYRREGDEEQAGGHRTTRRSQPRRGAAVPAEDDSSDEEGKEAEEEGVRAQAEAGADAAARGEGRDEEGAEAQQSEDEAGPGPSGTAVARKSTRTKAAARAASQRTGEGSSAEGASPPAKRVRTESSAQAAAAAVANAPAAAASRQSSGGADPVPASTSAAAGPSTAAAASGSGSGSGATGGSCTTDLGAESSQSAEESYVETTRTAGVEAASPAPRCSSAGGGGGEGGAAGVACGLSPEADGGRPGGGGSVAAAPGGGRAGGGVGWGSLGAGVEEGGKARVTVPAGADDAGSEDEFFEGLATE